MNEIYDLPIQKPSKKVCKNTFVNIHLNLKKCSPNLNTKFHEKFQYIRENLLIQFCSPKNLK